MHRTCVLNRLRRRVSHKSSPKLDSHTQGKHLFLVLFPKRLLQGLILMGKEFRKSLICCLFQPFQEYVSLCWSKRNTISNKGRVDNHKGESLSNTMHSSANKMYPPAKNINSYLKYSRWCRLVQAVQVIRSGLLKSCFLKWSAS